MRSGYRLIGAVGEHLRQWWRYPFRVAGPVPVVLLVAVAVTGAVSALARAGLFWEAFAGAAVFYVGDKAALTASRRYARKRAIPIAKPNPGSVRQLAANWLKLLFGGSVSAVVIVLGWRFGWAWTLLAGALLTWDVGRRWRWVRIGYVGDRRWARGWSPGADGAPD